MSTPGPRPDAPPEIRPGRRRQPPLAECLGKDAGGGQPARPSALHPVLYCGICLGHGKLELEIAVVYTVGNAAGYRAAY